MNLIQFVFHRATWHKLPVMPRQYSTEFAPQSVDDDTATLMQLTHTRCPQGVEVLKRKYHAATPRILIEQLPPRRRPRRIRSRLMSVLRRVAGTTAYDPIKSIARRHMRRG